MVTKIELNGVEVDEAEAIHALEAKGHTVIKRRSPKATFSSQHGWFDRIRTVVSNNGMVAIDGTDLEDLSFRNPDYMEVVAQLLLKAVTHARSYAN